MSTLRIVEKRVGDALAMLARHGFAATGFPRMLEINGVKRAIFNGERVNNDEK